VTSRLNPSRASAISRRAAKTVTWRLIAAAITAALVYAFTGQLELAGAIAGIELVTKMVAYFLHETAWDWKCKQPSQTVATYSSYSTIGVPVHAE
jgi:uncharacterized membrane protein